MYTFAEIYESCLKKDSFLFLTVNGKPWISFKQEILHVCFRKIFLDAMRMKN